jgi:hypothetical protein
MLLQGSHGNDATEIFSGSNSDSIKVEAPRRRMGLGEKTNILVDRVSIRFYEILTHGSLFVLGFWRCCPYISLL